MGQQYSHLSSEERILIEKLHCEQHLSIRRTAERIGRDKSTVSRELRRGLWFASNENGSYRPYRPKRLKTGPCVFCQVVIGQCGVSFPSEKAVGFSPVRNWPVIARVLLFHCIRA
ncbi:helix-turn-helix domain-containing protein, partial [Bifidobacterium bifidum]|uniref:helix-turn-helix domain-containing protein n=2 Tax=Bifidobacterium bifidum TaxID=1681 RepID=UPI003B9A7F7F